MGQSDVGELSLPPEAPDAGNIYAEPLAPNR